MIGPARLRTYLLALLLPTLLLPLVAPAAADARTGTKWPGTRITYYDATRDKIAVRRAVNAWNGTGMRMRFVRTFNRTRANIVIRNTRNVPGGCGTGLATLGYVGRGRQGTVNILHGPAKSGQACAWPGQTFVVTHELGHVLGLDHDDRACALMNSSHTNGIAASECLPGLTSNDHVGQWRCRLIEWRDAARAVRMYGGKVRARRANPWCNLVLPPPPPEPLTATLDDSRSTMTLMFRQPQPRTFPAYLATSNGASYEIYQNAGSCLTTRPSRAGDVQPIASFSYSGAPGQDETYDLFRPDAGTWCWSAWSIDALGRPSWRPATVTLDVPAAADSRSRIGRSTARPASPVIADAAATRYDLRGDAR